MVNTKRTSKRRISRRHLKKKKKSKKLILKPNKKSKLIDKEELIHLAKKYSVNYKSSSKRQIAKNLCDLRSSYMTKKEKLYIMPIVPNNRNKEIMKQYINNKPKKLP